MEKDGYISHFQPFNVNHNNIIINGSRFLALLPWQKITNQPEILMKHLLNLIIIFLLFACGNAADQASNNDSGNNTSNNSDNNDITLLAPEQLTLLPLSVQSIQISWKGSGKPNVRYALYWSNNPDVTKLSGNRIPNVTSPYVHDDLKNNLTYYYMVTEIDDSGEGPESASANATPLPYPPGVPELSVDIGDGKNVLTWSPIAGAESYNLYWSKQAGVTKENSTKETGVESGYEHLQLDNGTAYYYRLSAINVGGESNLSNEIAATPVAPITMPQAPTGFQAVANQTSVTLTWDNMAVADSYNLYWSNSPGVNKSNGNLLTKVTAPYVHDSLEQDKPYYYVLTAVNRLGEGPESGEATATPRPEWKKLLDTVGYEHGSSVAVDSLGNSYLTGYTRGAMAVQSKTGTDSDVFIGKFNLAGNAEWLFQLDTGAEDTGVDVAVDSQDNVIVAGTTTGDITGQGLTVADRDVFIAKYSSNGQRLWIKQFDYSGYNSVLAMTLDSKDNIYVNDYGGGYFIAKYDPDGVEQWRKPGPPGLNMVLDNADNILVSYGSGYSIYNSAGDFVLSHDIALNDSVLIKGIAVDPLGNVCMTGVTGINVYDANGQLISVNDNIVVAVQDANGTVLYIKEVASATNDYANGAAMDANGNCFITGLYSNRDLFIAKYNLQGEQQWQRIITAGSITFGNAIALFSDHSVFITGQSAGDFAGTGKPGTDYGAIMMRAAQ